MHPVSAQAFNRSIKQNAMEFAAMYTDFWHGVARMAATRFFVDELAETVEESTLQVFNPHRFQLGLQTQACQLAHSMRQQCDANT